MDKESAIIWDSGKIKQARVESQFAADDAAKFLNITPEYLSMLENGKRQPSPRTLNKLSILYRRPIGYFLISEKNFAEA